jgi:hypothetical protein
MVYVCSIRVWRMAYVFEAKGEKERASNHRKQEGGALMTDWRLAFIRLPRFGQCGRAAAGCERAAAAFCAASTMLSSALLAI